MFGYNLISNKKVWSIVFTILLFSIYNVYGQVFPLKNTAFNTIVVSQKGSIKNIHSGANQKYLDSLFVKKDQVQELIKTKNSQFIVTRGTGIVYRQKSENDSLIAFERIDSTQFDGYNFDDIKFEYNDTLFSIGGFGFWRNNGQVRYFTENKEWELLFSELTVGISNRNLWNLNQEKGLFFAIVKANKADYKLVKIDLKRKNWNFEPLPSIIHSEVLLMNENPIQIQINNKTGSLLCFSNKLYYLDLEKRLLKTASNNKLLNFINKQKINEASYFENNGMLYVLNLNTFIIDSIYFNDNEFSALAQNAGQLDNYKFISILLGILFLIGIVIFYISSKKKKSNLEMNEFEKEFIKKLTNKKGAIIDINNLNYLLGLSKKSIEIQKKNRSEFLNKLNQKLKEVLNTEENIIIRIKDEEDKRVFIYKLDETYFEKIEEEI
jgi:hypothetical protein